MAENTNQRPPTALNSSNDSVAIAGFVLGVLSLLISLMPACGTIGLVSLALSLIGRSSSRYRRLASWGAGLSVVALALSLATLLGFGPWRLVLPYQRIHFDF